MPDKDDPTSRTSGTNEPEDRPVAIGGAVWGAEETTEETDEEAGSTGYTWGEDEQAVPPGVEDLEEAPPVDRPGTELAVAVACLGLSLTTLLPWYGSGATTVTGFRSGNLGPVIFFLGVAGVAIVLLRRLRVRLSFPLEHGIILEGIGWLAVVGIVFKRFVVPKFGDFSLGLSEAYFFVFNGLMLGLLCAVVIALLAGRLSTGSPFVLRPGWIAQAGGKLGAGLLAVTLIAGISFGFFNEPNFAGPTASDTDVKTYKNQQPPCMKGAIPVPKGMRLGDGTETIQDGKVTSCQASMSTTLSVKKTRARFMAAFKTENITTGKPRVFTSGATYILTKPCGVLNIQRLGKRTQANLVTGSVYCNIGRQQQTP